LHFKAPDGRKVEPGEYEAAVFKDPRDPLPYVQVVSTLRFSPEVLRNYAGRVRIVGISDEVERRRSQALLPGATAVNRPDSTYLELSGRFRVWEYGEGHVAVDFVLRGKAKSPGIPTCPLWPGCFAADPLTSKGGV